MHIKTGTDAHLFSAVDPHWDLTHLLRFIVTLFVKRVIYVLVVRPNLRPCVCTYVCMCLCICVHACACVCVCSPRVKRGDSCERPLNARPSLFFTRPTSSSLSNMFHSFKKLFKVFSCSQVLFGPTQHYNKTPTQTGRNCSTVPVSQMEQDFLSLLWEHLSEICWKLENKLWQSLSRVLIWSWTRFLWNISNCECFFIEEQDTNTVDHNLKKQFGLFATW